MLLQIYLNFHLLSCHWIFVMTYNASQFYGVKYVSKEFPLNLHPVKQPENGGNQYYTHSSSPCTNTRLKLSFVFIIRFSID